MQAYFIKTKKQHDILQKLDTLHTAFRSRESELNVLNSYPLENILALKAMGYTTLTLPTEYGGDAISLYDFVLFQEKLGQLSAPTALAIGWHLGIVKDIATQPNWQDPALLADFFTQIKQGKLTNRAASEFATGSPTRGGLPTTTAQLSADGANYILTGEKSYTTLAPMLDYFLVTATLSGEICEFLVPKTTEGVSIVPGSWNSMSMRGTASQILKLDRVALPKNHLTVNRTLAKKSGHDNGWLLHIPACYLGLAQAALDEAILFAKSHTPNSLNAPLITLPTIVSKLGEIALELTTARHFLYSICEKYDAGLSVATELGAVKHVVTNAAVSAVDHAMRIVGAKSLTEDSYLWQLYTNVRAGLHNPPMDDVVVTAMGQQAINAVH